MAITRSIFQAIAILAVALVAGSAIGWFLRATLGP
jgi:hypothetical protein